MFRQERTRVDFRQGVQQFPCPAALGQVLAQPAQPAADEPVPVPPPAGDLGTDVSQPFTSPGARPTSDLVFDLPSLLVHEVGTPQAQVHLGVVTQVDHPIGTLHCAAAPALPVAVVGHVDCGDRFGAHQPSVRVTFDPGSARRRPRLPRAPAHPRTQRSPATLPFAQHSGQRCRTMTW